MDLLRLHFDQIDSTNSWAKRHAHPWMSHGQMLLITASNQTAGRGRRGRRWLSVPGLNVHATFCFIYPSKELSQIGSNIGSIAQVAAVAAASALTQLGFFPQLKWPNDILLSHKKAGGILCETTPIGDELLVIVGIGINVNMTPEQLEAVGRPATSLFVEGGQQLEIEQVLAFLQKSFAKVLKQYTEEGLPPILAQYKRYLVHQPGTALRFHHGDEIVTGAFAGLADDGSLIMRTDAGSLATFPSGEIE